MKNWRKLSTLITICLIIYLFKIGILSASTIYVSTSGNDNSGDGDINRPFRTIGHALTIAQSGDEIVLRGSPTLTNNIYNESIRIQQQNINLRSHTGEWAIIQCPINDENIGQCISFDVDSDGSSLKRIEVIGGYYYGIKMETKWDWGDPNDRSGASNILLEDLKVHDTGRDAIKITPGCDNITIRRAEIFNTGKRDDTNAEGIDNVNGDNMIVQDSYIHNIATNGIYFKGGSTDSIVERNIIENVGGAGILIGFDTSPEYFDLTVNPDYYESIRGIVRNNIVINTKMAGIGLYAAKDAQVWNNTLIDTAQAYHSPIYFGITYQDWDASAKRPPSINPVIRNNIVYQSSGLPSECVSIRYSNDLNGLFSLSGMPDMDYNIYFHVDGNCLFSDNRPSSLLQHEGFSQWQAHISGESHSQTVDPQVSKDGHIQVNSPAIDNGTCTNAPGDDFDRDSRPYGSNCDIGADEFTTDTQSLKSLTVIKSGSGSGNITSNSAGINCGSDCQEKYSTNTNIILTATPDENSYFTGWEQDCSGCGNNTDCEININTSMICKAVFSLKQYRLMVIANGEGNGSIITEPSGIAIDYPENSSMSASFAAGTRIILTAKAGEGSRVSWTVCSGSISQDEPHTSVCTIENFTKNETVSANFSLNQIKDAGIDIERSDIENNNIENEEENASGCSCSVF